MRFVNPKYESHHLKQGVHKCCSRFAADIATSLKADTANSPFILHILEIFSLSYLNFEIKKILKFCEFFTAENAENAEKTLTTN